MYGITTKNITNANGALILKGEKVQCLFVTETGVKFLSDFSNIIFNN